MIQDRFVEPGAAALAIVAAAVIALSPSVSVLLAPISLLAVVAWIVWRDARDFIVPNGAAFALGALGLGVRLAADGVTPWSGLIALGDGLACGGALWAVREAFYRLRGHDGLGFGDVKLAAGAGVLVGLTGFAVALLAASLAGLAIAALRAVTGAGVSRTDRLPLGALLAPAAFGVWALGLGAIPI